jgi:CarboxypepD_reg-like domain
MTTMNRYKTYFLVCILLFFVCVSFAQNPLQKNISIQVKSQRLGNVLEIMSNAGNFNFSYNSNIVKRDSLVTVVFTNKPVKDILDFIFKTGYEYIESGNYIILRKKPIVTPPPQTIVKPVVTEEKNYFVKGYIIDEATGEKIDDASVYEAKQLASDLTNENGFFKIKLKSKYKTASVTVSKFFYKDTTIYIEPKLNQTIYISIQREEDTSAMVNVTPEDFLLPDSVEVESPSGEKLIYTKTDSIKVQKSWIGKFLLSSKQKVQSVNLKKFFATRDFQLSFVPGTSTQGKLSTQVTNKFSINVLGGYTAGVKVLEMGGLFNINKKNVQYFQAAGLFNTVGGSVKGFQAAGVQNLVFDSVHGFQAAGVSNYVKGKFRGLQTAGVYNHVSDSMKGAQIAGVANFSKRTVNGVQIAGILNYTKKLKGVQIGLINIADTSEGYSIGLINIIKHGYHKISVSSNEVTQLNVAYKSGNPKLYSILQAGANLNTDKKLFSFGYGIGRDNKLSKQLSLTTELTSNNIYAGTWDYYNSQNKLSLNLQWQAAKKFSVYAGPSFSLLLSDQKTAVQGYQFPLPSPSYKQFSFGGNATEWIGFTVGVNFF